MRSAVKIVEINTQLTFYLKNFNLDLLLIAAENDDNFTFNTITDSLNGVYLAASDTTKNTLLWLLLVLSENEEYQNKWIIEINKSMEKYGEIIEDECPYISSFLLENIRKYPVADSLWHVATENVTFGDYKITKGATFQGE